ncbi:MAG: hypothetical protein ACI8XO_004094 [Verrucomicrobiales bacterium]|jgi:hypothetical protein
MESGKPFRGDDKALEPVGRGTQGDVFGSERWVVKVPRFTLLSVLAKWVSSWRWNAEVRDSLGGLAAPFLLLENVRFLAPKMTGRSAKLRRYRKKMAVARERFDTDAFLDHRLSLAEPAEALALVEEMVVLVERVRARGFYMHDFIMGNFALVDGRLMIVDTGLISPLRTFWDPAMRICAWGFSRGLSKDYQRLLGELLEEVEDGVLRGRIIELRELLPQRLGRLRKKVVAGLEVEAAMPVGFDFELEKEIRAALASVR